MSTIKNSVLLLKTQPSETEPDKYERILNDSGYTTFQVNPLDFNFIGLNVLSERLENFNNYSGIVFSSPRCVKAVAEAIGETRKELIKKWREKNNFAVGEATTDLAQKLLGIRCRGGNTGNAENLAKFIIEENKHYEKPFLFPHGNLASGVLQKRLSEADISMETIMVYETVANPNLEKEFADVTSNFLVLPEIVVFFSPSGVDQTLNLIKKVPLDLNEIKFVAIGPVTEKKLIEENLPILGVAKKPTPEEVLKTIKSK